MVTKVDIVTFIDFIDSYCKGVNGGGTFTCDELVEWVKEIEDRKYFEKLIEESLILKTVLVKEDWEIDNSILNFVCKNGGRNKMKRIINCLLEK